MEHVLILSLCVDQTLQVLLDLLKYFDLNELLQRLVLLWLVNQINISFFVNYKTLFCELILVLVQLVFEKWNFSFGMLILQVTKLLLVFLLELRLLKVEILLLSLNDDGKLRLFRFGLFDKPFKLRNLFEILDFLVGNFLVELVLLLLCAKFVHHIGIGATNRQR